MQIDLETLHGQSSPDFGRNTPPPMRIEVAVSQRAAHRSTTRSNRSASTTSTGSTPSSTERTPRLSDRTRSVRSKVKSTAGPLERRGFAPSPALSVVHELPEIDEDDDGNDDGGDAINDGTVYLPLATRASPPSPVALAPPAPTAEPATTLTPSVPPSPSAPPPAIAVSATEPSPPAAPLIATATIAVDASPARAADQPCNHPTSTSTAESLLRQVIEQRRVVEPPRPPRGRPSKQDAPTIRARQPSTPPTATGAGLSAEATRPPPAVGVPLSNVMVPALPMELTRTASPPVIAAVEKPRSSHHQGSTASRYSAAATRRGVAPRQSRPTNLEREMRRAALRAGGRGVTAHKVSWDPTLLAKPMRKAVKSGEVDLSVMGNTHRMLNGIAMESVVHREAPMAPINESALTLALTSRSKDTWHKEQLALTTAMSAAYGAAGGGVVSKKGSFSSEGPVDRDEKHADVRTAEYVPKVRATVRAMQETMRLKGQAAINPRLLNQSGQAAQAREQINERHQQAIERLQAAARGLTARRQAKSRMSNFRARKTVNSLAERFGSQLRVEERV